MKKTVTPKTNWLQLNKAVIKKNYPKHFFRLEKIDKKRKVKRTYTNGRVFDPVLQRKENRKNGRLLNHGFPVSSEEISKILEMYLGGSDADDLELYFQRPKITIKKIINDSKSDPGSTELPKTQKKVIDLVKVKIYRLISENESLFKKMKDNSGSVYVLLLEENKLYVGFTGGIVEKRIESHFKRRGSSWVKKYKPLKVILVLESYKDEVEGWVTGFLMKEFGFNNVRGYSFSKTDKYDKLPDYVNELPFL